MALDIIKLYISLISEFFLLSDKAVTSPTLNNANTTPPLLPKNSNSLTAAHYLTRILGEVQETVNEIAALEISSEVSANTKGFLESTRWKFEDILIHTWLRGDYLAGLREKSTC